MHFSKSIKSKVQLVEYFAQLIQNILQKLKLHFHCWMGSFSRIIQKKWLEGTLTYKTMQLLPWWSVLSLQQRLFFLYSFFSKVFLGLEFRCEFQAGFTSWRSRKSEVSLFSHCQKWQWCLTWTETSGSMFGHIFPAARRCHRRHRGQAVKVSDKDQCWVSHCVTDEREEESENIIFCYKEFLPVCFLPGLLICFFSKFTQNISCTSHTFNILAHFYLFFAVKVVFVSS